MANGSKKESKVSVVHKDEDEGHQTPSSSGARSPVLSPKPLRISKDRKCSKDWELNFKDLFFEEKIGTGASATVYKGKHYRQH
jgi:hypothetical protein